MAKTTPTRRKLTLENGETSTAALPAIRSAYELMGIKDTRYRERSFAAYQARIQQMDLVELHDEAFDVALPCSPDRGYMIKLLEEKFLKENPVERGTVVAAQRAESAKADRLTVAERAKRILADAR